MKVLGVDPGLRNCGVVLFHCPAGAQHPRDLEPLGMTALWTDSRANNGGWGQRKTDSNADRTRLIVRGIRGIVGQHRPALVCFEQFNSDRAVVMQQMGFVLGALVALADGWDAPMISRLPTELKLAAHGKRRADKQQMIAGVERVWGPGHAATMRDHMRDVPQSRHDHAYDACAAVAASWDHQLFRAARSAHLAATNTSRGPA